MQVERKPTFKRIWMICYFLAWLLHPGEEEEAMRLLPKKSPKLLSLPKSNNLFPQSQLLPPKSQINHDSQRTEKVLSTSNLKSRFLPNLVPPNRLLLQQKNKTMSKRKNKFPLLHLQLKLLKSSPTISTRRTLKIKL